jgi:hypothetical protein
MLDFILRKDGGRSGLVGEYSHPAWLLVVGLP